MEADLQRLIAQVILDMINLAGLPFIHLATELGLTNLWPDIWVLSASGIPISMVKVKRPSPTIMDHSSVHGQIFNYMHCIKTFFSIEHVFRIVMTYSKWRFYWFMESDHYTAADTCAAIEDLRGARNIGSVRGDDNNDNNNDDNDDDDDGLVKEDKSLCLLHGTKVYSAEKARPVLSALLASVIYKMCYSLCTIIHLLLASICICMDQTQWFWAQVSRTIKDLNNTDILSRRTMKFFLLHDLCGGADGRAWWACMTSGTGCVIKFCKRDPREDPVQLLEEEAQVWRTAWGVKGMHVATLVGEPALVMPYTHAVKEPVSGQAEQQVQEVIHRMASSGYCHKDLAWCHVGRLRLRQQ